MYDEFYQEKLPCGGKLKVSKKTWEIEYYYPGLDGRYSGAFFTIYSNEIDSFTQSLINNFVEYIDLKGKIPAGGDYQKPGEKGMMIAVGRLFEGVSIHGFNDFISIDEQLKNRINSFEIAKKRALKIQYALAAI
ncbi:MULTISPECIES: hypothetical protein [unclassified Pantoea]|uniref:hypothetical protein n=1 Tax=unclassified Pantoea TaxID=2630326 RepID=UPI00123239DF|nr:MULTISPECIES: hypothetical protein [unclassified Pantoea]KAA5971990.1 hypothetical protein F3I51_09945 [Pantoea sp. M_6]KAA5977260.1 hypothetical protein F3I52_09200 [Pantoea sp. M_8]KAA5993454.1 hypothetical protein F3I47_00085 [Pantoea sp. M_10]MCJ7926306.1 hypothetical protein [Pantoea vagans]